MHQLALREGRVAKRVGLAQVEPAVLDDDLIGRDRIGPIGEDEILRRIGADHACANLQILRANPVRETEGREGGTRLMLEEVLAVPEREHHLILGIRQDRIRPRTACEGIAPHAPGELVIAITARQHVVPASPHRASLPASPSSVSLPSPPTS